LAGLIWKLAQISERAVLEDLGEALLDGADGAAWLVRRESMAMANPRGRGVGGEGFFSIG